LVTYTQSIALQLVYLGPTSNDFSASCATCYHRSSVYMLLSMSTHPSARHLQQSSEATACMRQLLCTAVSQLSSDQLVPLHHHARTLHVPCMSIFSYIYLSALFLFVAWLIMLIYRVTNASTAMPTQHTQIQHIQQDAISTHTSTTNRRAGVAAQGCHRLLQHHHYHACMLQAPVNCRNRSAQRIAFCTHAVRTLFVRTLFVTVGGYFI
jgi:hypothetical protein